MARDLEHKSIEELQQLAGNDIALIEMVTNDETLQSVQVEVQSAQENNKMLAQENLNYADNKIPSLRSQLHSLHTSISHTNEQLNQMLAQYNSLSCSSLPFDDLRDQLKIEASESDEKSEKIAEEFLNGSIDLDAFLQTYKDARKSAHLARIKADKFAELVEQERIKRQQQSSLANMTNWSGNASIAPSSTTAGVPGMPTVNKSATIFNPYLINQGSISTSHHQQQPQLPYPAHTPFSAYPAAAAAYPS
ncbi:vacuolar protein sorting-associated protein 37C-like [Convolutriloba macropyga]|uniref:vacuolar protein sorting-associated protein 37C-like n=1 Tax=Convolutriloba macropyga TaxID=536237 RepID=UPI003F528D8D